MCLYITLFMNLKEQNAPRDFFLQLHVSQILLCLYELGIMKILRVTIAVCSISEKLCQVMVYL